MKTVAVLSLLAFGTADLIWLNTELIPAALDTPASATVALKRAAVDGVGDRGGVAAPAVEPKLPRAKEPAAPRSSTDSVAQNNPDPHGAAPIGAAPPSFPALSFATGGANLDSAAKDVLDEVARFLGSRPNTRVVLRGHSDNRGRASANRRLARRRAVAARARLLELGIEADRVAAKSAGAREPAVQANTPAAWATNRRVEIRLKGDRQ